jgi:hypothetical protein
MVDAPSPVKTRAVAQASSAKATTWRAPSKALVPASQGALDAAIRNVVKDATNKSRTKKKSESSDFDPLNGKL